MKNKNIDSLVHVLMDRFTTEKKKIGATKIPLDHVHEFLQIVIDNYDDLYHREQLMTDVYNTASNYLTQKGWTYVETKDSAKAFFVLDRS